MMSGETMTQSLRDALDEELAWHEREDKALSKSGRSDADYYWQRDQHRQRIAALNATLQAASQEATQEGWTQVPAEPTDAMVIEGYRVGTATKTDAADVYRAMLSAAPTPPAQPQAVGAVRVAKISAALAVLQQDYSPECLEMASTREYVEDAVSQLIDAGYSPTAPQGEAQAGEAGLALLKRLTHAGWCPSLIYDDNGNWAVCEDGSQNIRGGGDDLSITWFVEARFFKPSIREALAYYVEQNRDAIDAALQAGGEG